MTKLLRLEKVICDTKKVHSTFVFFFKYLPFFKHHVKIGFNKTSRLTRERDQNTSVCNGNYKKLVPDYTSDDTLSSD